MTASGKILRNVFACLVHENQECVIDLVRNLRFLDPSSSILLYNGGPDPKLLRAGFPFERYGAILYPSPRPMVWGRLHDFALDCMRFALEQVPFDTLTIVDSDQLATRAGYSAYLAAYLDNRNSVGCLSNAPQVFTETAPAGPVQAAFREIDLWRPFLRRFESGERKFAHWSFWPSTVFTAGAARELTRIFADDTELREILQRSAIWATEEVVLPTLAALLGFDIAANPCADEYVKYRVDYGLPQIESALARSDVFWVHPVPRVYGHPLRSRIRSFHGEYETAPRGSLASAPERSGLILSMPILQRMKQVEGWLDEEEGDLLITASARSVSSHPPGSALVEIGSFCGRGTVVLASVVQSLGLPGSVYAIDAHDGKVGALDKGVRVLWPTSEILRRNIDRFGLDAEVRMISGRVTDIEWDQHIAFLLIDGLHDYPNVARDFYRFEEWVLPGGYVAFHDYADYFPGVKSFVNELLAQGGYFKIELVKSLILLQKDPSAKARVELRPSEASEPAFGPVAAAPRVAPCAPLVSCLMPTANRRMFLPLAIGCFLRQDYRNSELIIVDDGSDSVQDLIPADERIRYVRLPARSSIGAKHNLACELARGDVIVHWDDDDWSAPWRITYQVEALLRKPSDSLCGLSSLFFYEPQGRRAWEYVYPLSGPPWLSGATFCYRKQFWESRHFPDMGEGGDTMWVWSLRDANVAALANHGFYVATVHVGNTSRKQTSTAGWQPRSSQELRRVLDDEGWSFYECLSASKDSGRRVGAALS